MLTENINTNTIVKSGGFSLVLCGQRGS